MASFQFGTEIVQASLSNDQKIDYNKNNIEKILYKSTNKNIEVFLSYSNEQKQDTTGNSAADELIERINLYLSKQKEYPQHYLVIECTSSSLVDTAYLAELRYSNKRQHWKLYLTPLVHYDQVYQRETYLTYQLAYILINIRGCRSHYDTNIKSASIEKVIEHAKLRIKYLNLNDGNFQQYQSELNSIKLSRFSIYEEHKKILEQSPSDSKYLEPSKLNVLQMADDTARSSK